MDYKAFIDSAVENMRSRVDGRVVGTCSGGVDSTVTSILVHMAVGDQHACYFIDSGFMRSHDYEDARRNLARFGVELGYEECSDTFFRKLGKKRDPEKKRWAFREGFYESLTEVVRREGARYLAQGTIEADRVETDRGLKTQHNVGLEQMGVKHEFELIEPLRELYKDGVRGIARYLGLHELAERMPFPGPGLATRVEGEVTRRKVDLIRTAHEIVEEEARKNGIRPFQIFPTLLESKATAVVDGKRDFTNIIMIRSVDSENAMTATVTEIPYAVLKAMAHRLTSELPIKRVSYDLTDKPPATIEII